jgi:hypothetical protein
MLLISIYLSIGQYTFGRVLELARVVAELVEGATAGSRQGTGAEASAMLFFSPGGGSGGGGGG